MDYGKILLCMTVFVCLTFQACAQSDPLGESARGTDQGRDEMVGWLDQPDPLPADVTESTTTATGTNPSPDATKSTTKTRTTTATEPTSTTKSTTTTSTTAATEPTSTTTATATSTTPGFEATFAVAGILAVTFIALRRRR